MEGKAWCMHRTNGAPMCALRCSGNDGCYQGQVCQAIAGQGGVCVPEGSSKQIPKRDGAVPPPPKKDTGTPPPPKHDVGVGPKPDTKPPPTGCAGVCPSGNWSFKVDAKVDVNPYPPLYTLVASVVCTSKKSFSIQYKWHGSCSTTSATGSYSCTLNDPGKLSMSCISGSVKLFELSVCGYNRLTGNGTLAGSTVTGTITGDLTGSNKVTGTFTATCK